MGEGGYNFCGGLLQFFHDSITRAKTEFDIYSALSLVRIGRYRYQIFNIIDTDKISITSMLARNNIIIIVDTAYTISLQSSGPGLTKDG